MATRLGEKLRDLRKQRGLTLEKLADMAGLSKSYLWELENRESQRPSAEKLTALADALGVGTSFFLEDDLQNRKKGILMMLSSGAIKTLNLRLKHS